MQFDTFLIEQYIKNHFKSHRMINVNHQNFNMIIQKHTLFIIDYFYILNNQKFDDKLINLVNNFQKNKQIISYLKNSTLYFYHILCEEVYFTEQNKTLIKGSLISVFFKLSGYDINQNDSFLKNHVLFKSLFNIFYVFHNRIDILKSFNRHINTIFNSSFEVEELKQIFLINSDNADEIFFTDEYNFYYQYTTNYKLTKFKALNEYFSLKSNLNNF